MTHNHTATNVLNRPPRVMVVEDDLTSREFLCRVLEKTGCVVAPADGADAAQRLFADRGTDSFDLVVTDYQMPGRTGLDLLEWLQETDPSLAGIILTAAGEKEIVTKSLRIGASDFLEKPVDLNKLLPALHKAADATQRRRHLAETECAVKSLGQAQQHLIQFQPVLAAGGGMARIDIHFHPKLEAGGDFFCQFQPAPGQLCCLLTDVSGHDLQAAYISAYFQGMVRGMLQRATPMTEIFECFNRFLIEEWNGIGQFRLQKKNASTSVAATSVLLDFHAQTAGVLCYGAPAPVYVSRKGRAEWLGTGGGAPLGWFPDQSATITHHDIREGGKICLWTDGLNDLADTLGVQPLCLAYVLEAAKQNRRQVPQLDHAPDDILVAEIFLPSIIPAPATMKVLFLAEYHGGQKGDIDQLVSEWRHNLSFAIPGCSESFMHDLLLAAREAVLNAMEHGCQGDPAKKLCFQFCYFPESQAVKVWVEDSGSGHQFDFVAHAENTASKIIDEHRGLIFMMNLAHAIHFERHGATVVMEFHL